MADKLKLANEEHNYQHLDKFQKEVVDALKEIGFKWQYGTTYSREGYSQVDVRKLTSLSKVIQFFHKDGKDQKRFEFQRVIGIE